MLPVMLFNLTPSPHLPATMDKLHLLLSTPEVDITLSGAALEKWSQDAALEAKMWLQPLVKGRRDLRETSFKQRLCIPRYVPYI